MRESNSDMEAQSRERAGLSIGGLSLSLVVLRKKGDLNHFRTSCVPPKKENPTGVRLPAPPVSSSPMDYNHYKDIAVSRDGPVLTICINRAKK
jgi:hypothetical protein